MKNNYRRFVLVGFLCSLLLLLPAGLGLVVSMRAGEMDSTGEIVARQLEEQALYGTAFHQAISAYKLELVRAVQPGIAVLGSSRAMQVRAELFDHRFVNLGGGMNSLEGGVTFARRLFKVARPSVLLVSLDFWWFHPDAAPEGDSRWDDSSLVQVTLSKLWWPWRGLSDGDLRWRDLFSLLLSGGEENGIAAYPCIGLDAIFEADGYRPDGAYFYGSKLFSAKSSKAFDQVIRQIRSGTGRFAHGEHVSARAFADLDGLVAFCREQGVTLRLFVPPMSPGALAAMRESGGFGYVDELLPILRERYGAFVYHDGRGIGMTPCEFVDDFHAGEVASARMMLDMARHDGLLRREVDDARLEASIRRFAGSRLLIFEPARYLKREIGVAGCGD